MRIIEYEEIKLLKQSEKSTVHLVREKGGEKVFVKKILSGKQSIYLALQNCLHPYLPKLYEVVLSDDVTTVIEEYIEGQSLGNAELSEKQILGAVKELCSVLEFLHGKDIIHRDIKPSNMILAKDGHIRLIDFDAARMKKDGLEQDTRLLGTRGYAPPEQYGFSQTDARADIYSLGVTLEQLLGIKARKPRYRRIIQKCTNMNPDKRYQSTRQVKKAFSRWKRGALYSCTALMLIVCLWCVIPRSPIPPEAIQPDATSPMQPAESLDTAAPTVLSAPENPHWKGETGIGVWGNVPESGTVDEVSYYWKMYRRDTETPPDINRDECDLEGGMKGNFGQKDKNFPTYEVNMGTELWENGFYYFAVCAVGDGTNYTNSPYVLSDAFAYTGESAPPLPTPTGLEWRMMETDIGRQFYGAWSNLDEYADTDSFDVTVYNQAGEYIMNNIWSKERIVDVGYNGIRIRPEFLPKVGGPYRFTVQALTSRPNEYQSSPMPDPVPEEYFSPWYDPSSS